jgi:hypothetical protein
MQSMQENCLGTIYAAGVSQRHFIAAEKKTAARVKVPGLCTVV